MSDIRRKESLDSWVQQDQEGQPNEKKQPEGEQALEQHEGTTSHREPDELDALLRRTETPQNLLDNLGYNAISKSHRKSMSIGGAAAPGLSIEVTNRQHGILRASGRRQAPSHRKNKSSISELLALAGGSLVPLREDFQEVALNLRRQFVQGLDKMDRGETGNYDMSLTQSLSVLPDNVLDLAHEAGMEEHDKEGRTPLVQYLTLLGAVAGISSNSTALHMLTGEAAPMKLFWRMSASYLILSPLAIHYLIKDGIPKLSVGGWLTFAMAILCFAIQNCLFYTALQYTTIGNAVIYSNSQAVLLIIGKGCVGEPIHLFEGIGVVVATHRARSSAREYHRILLGRKTGGRGYGRHGSGVERAGDK